MNDKESITELSLKLPKNKAISVVTKNELPLSYIMIGVGKVNMESKIKSIDLIKEMITMTKPEIFAVYALKSSSRWLADEITGRKYSDGISELRVSDWETDAEHRMFQRGVKKLIEKGLAIKLNNRQYMINPLAVIPSERLMAIRQWNQSVKNRDYKIAQD